MPSEVLNITHLFFDAPIIYYAERNPHYFNMVEFVFDQTTSLGNGSMLPKDSLLAETRASAS